MIVVIRRSLVVVVLLVVAGCTASPLSPSPNPTASSAARDLEDGRPCCTVRLFVTAPLPGQAHR